MKIYKIILFILMTSSIIIPQTNFQTLGKIENVSKKENIIYLKFNNALLNIYLFTDNIIRFRYTNNIDFAKDFSYSIEDLNKFKLQNYEFVDGIEKVIIKTKTLKIEIDKNDGQVIFFDNNNVIINQDEKGFGVTFDNDEVRVHKTLFDDEKFYGLGEKTGELNKRGKQYIMWNTDHPAYDWNYDPLYISVPFFIGIRKTNSYGIFFDNTYKSIFNFGASSNRFYWFGAEKGELNYYFIYGQNVREIIENYTNLTGKISLPPMWALGYQQSKWSYYPESAVREITKKFRDKKIPCDAIYLDIHYMENYKVFSWDKNRFPNFSKMLNDLKNDGMKTVVIIDPGVKADENYPLTNEGIKKDLFAKYFDGRLYTGEVWPSWSYFPDFTKLETKLWWGEQLAKFINVGIAGFWNDMNEPAVWGQSFPDVVNFYDNGLNSSHKKIHNIYALEMAKSNYLAYNKYFPNDRFFTLTRAGYAGIQKYSAVWTGDNVASEEHLRLACIMPQGMGISGLSFVGSDVGGFIDYPSSRLFLRWLQLGVFTPFFRAHSAINNPDKEPWAFGEETENIAREIISLRYKYLPLIYNEFYNSSITGLPIIRPMFLNFQDDENCYWWDAQYQFMIGENLLVAPVVSEKDEYKKLYLPKGDWIDLNTNKIYDGGKWIIYEAPLYRIPYFLRRGGVIVSQEVQQYVNEKNIDQIKFEIFNDETINYDLYLDDGKTNNYKTGDYLKLNLKSTTISNKLDLKISRTGNYDPKLKSIIIELFDIKNFDGVKSSNFNLKQLNVKNDLMKELNSFYYDESTNKLLINIEYKISQIEIYKK